NVIQQSKINEDSLTLYAANKPKKTNSKKPKSSKKPKKRSKTTKALPWPQNIQAMVGSGAVLVVDFHASPDEPKELISINPDKNFVPASILKLVTSGAALVTLGPDYRFRTAFYLDKSNNLWVKGYGDPFLVAEEMCQIADELTYRGLKNVNNIYIDSSFFEKDAVVDGTTFTSNPYDAFNSGFGVNFNTVNFLIDKSGAIVELNSCNPLTPITISLANKSFPKRKKRKTSTEKYLNISESPKMAEENGGQVLRELLTRRGVIVNGDVVTGETLPQGASIIYEHHSSKNLEEMIIELLKYSNNYVTNQIFLTMGAEVYGAPGNFDKGRQVVYDFLEQYGLPRLKVVEGSGLSRNNSVTAHQMSEVLRVMEPVRTLIKSDDDGTVYYKTGTMSDIQTLAGYIERPGRPNEPLTFVILLNGKYAKGTREKILVALKSHLVDKTDKPS
ncbi:MAG: D-alanyl-D-alanine carboxypeptidase, partial [Clostridiales Family XIII bacterium]|nr:D-alanyl-D-alanine carboxypeptidase [Clostridiales Family XIII bacterium]